MYSNVPGAREVAVMPKKPKTLLHGRDPVLKMKGPANAPSETPRPVAVKQNPIDRLGKFAHPAKKGRK